MPINLSGLDFNSALISELEKKLIEAGYNPDDFSVHKAVRISPYSYSRPSLRLYDYTVFIADKKFSIAFTDDAQFARFFYNLCCEDTRHSEGNSLLDAIIHRTAYYAEVTRHWLTGEAFSSDKP